MGSVVQVYSHSRFVGAAAADHCPGNQSDSTGNQPRFEGLDQIAIRARQDLFFLLHQRYLSAEVGEETGELDALHIAAKDEKMFWCPGQGQNVLVADDSLPVKRNAGPAHRLGSCSDDDPGSANNPLPDAKDAGIRKPALSLDHLHP